MYFGFPFRLMIEHFSLPPPFSIAHRAFFVCFFFLYWMLNFSYFTIHKSMGTAVNVYVCVCDFGNGNNSPKTRLNWQRNSRIMSVWTAICLLLSMNYLKRPPLASLPMHLPSVPYCEICVYVIYAIWKMVCVAMKELLRKFNRLSMYIFSLFLDRSSSFYIRLLLFVFRGEKYSHTPDELRCNGVDTNIWWLTSEHRKMYKSIYIFRPFITFKELKHSRKPASNNWLSSIMLTVTEYKRRKKKREKKKCQTTGQGAAGEWNKNQIAIQSSRRKTDTALLWCKSRELPFMF